MTQVTISKQEQAELFVIEMDAVQSELEQTGDYKVFASCKKSLEMLKAEIATLGFQVQRVPTGWKLVEPVVTQEAEVAQAASQPEVIVMREKQQEQATILFYATDQSGLFACVKSKSNAKKTYRVRISKELYSQTCECAAGNHGHDCQHRLLVDRDLDTERPTFSQQLAGVTVRRETITRLVAGRTVQQAA